MTDLSPLEDIYKQTQSYFIFATFIQNLYVNENFKDSADDL